MEKEGLSQTRPGLLPGSLPPQSHRFCAVQVPREHNSASPTAPRPGLQRRWSVAGAVMGWGPGLGARVYQSRFLCVRGSAGHAAPVLTSEGLHVPQAEPHVLCSYGHLHPPAGRRNPPTWPPGTVFPCTPTHLGTQVSPASAAPGRMVLMLTEGSWASLTPAAPDRREPQPSRGWGGLEPHRRVRGKGR